METLGDLGWQFWLAIVVFSLITSSIHGATGVAGGFLMAAVLANFVGVKPVVPIMSVALLVSHSSRTFLNIGSFDRRAFLTVVVPAVPFMTASAFIYGRLSSPTVALVLGGIVILSIPVRRWANSHEIRAGTFSLGSAGAVYGALSGLTVGPGMLLIPFLLGFGLSKEAFVATLAGIALVANIVRTSVFGASEILDFEYIVLGIIVGIATIPGNWFGRSVLRRMTNEVHANAVDVLTVIGALNFFWLAVR